MHLKKDTSGLSEEEIFTAMTYLGYISHKLDENDDDFNSNQLSPVGATVSVKL